MQTQTIKPKFPLGQVCATPGALEALGRSAQEPGFFLAKHVSGDWGDVDQEDWQENELSLREGFRILSVYTTLLGEKLWVLTEADRRVTTLLLPAEY